MVIIWSPKIPNIKGFSIADGCLRASRPYRFVIISDVVLISIASKKVSISLRVSEWALSLLSYILYFRLL